MEELAVAGIKLVNMDLESVGSSKDADQTEDYKQLVTVFVIKSLYLQRQDTDPEAEKYREYLQNKETFNANRRRQLFKKKEGYEERKQKLDYSNFSYNKRTCVVGIPKKKHPEKCGCNRDINDKVHKEFRMEEEHHGTWDFRKHTELEPSDAYGRVSFGSNQRAKYVRVDADTERLALFDLLTSTFKLPTPGVVISVTGSTLGFTVSSKIEKVIQRGLIKAAITTNGWITTCGYDSGHVKIIGDALRTNNGAVPCIGFSAWGCIPDVTKEALTINANNKRGVPHCKYPKNEIIPGSHQENLESNHSHFVLVDQGGVIAWGSESYLRNRIESYIRDAMNIPVVQVVLQGGNTTAQQLELSLKSGTPAVIVYGSGGVCDLVIDLIKHTESGSKTKEKKVRKSSYMCSINPSNDTCLLCTCNPQEGLSFQCPVVVKSMIDADLENQKDDRIFQNRIKKIITDYKDMLILFDMGDGHNEGFDTALLEGLVKAQNMTDEATAAGKQLSGVQVALDWNRPDFAEKLLKADIAAKDENSLGSLLVHALAWNLNEFTELLLSHGANISMVAANMVVLYGSCQHVDHLKRYVKYHMTKTGELNMNDKTTIDNMINALIGEHNNFESNVSNESDPFFELMVWAALSLYPDIAEMMWKQTQEPIKGALFVLMILRKLSRAKKVIVNNNEKETLKLMTDKFEKLAIHILDCLHENSEPTLCDKALNSGWERLDNMSYIDMAYSCKAKDFVAHPACQELQEKRWERGVISEVGIVTVILVTICPLLLMTPLVTFRRDWFSRESEHNCRCLRGIFIRKCKAFWRSPKVKFWTNVEFYSLFLIYQTYVILVKMDKTTKDTDNPSCDYNTLLTVPKMILYIWFLLFLLDEIVQVYTKHFWKWFNVFWNKLDALMYTVNLCGFILVNIPAAEDAATCFDEGAYNIGRIFLATSSILFYLRLNHMFIPDEALGPTILMTKKMMGDFKVFLLLFLVIVIAFGVGYAVVLTDPSDLAADDTISVLYGMLFYPVFQMYGELFVEDLSSEGGAPKFPSKNETLIRDSGRTGFVVVLVAVYMAMVVLMLVNILIAMFSNTYSKIKKREDVIFKFQRLELLMEMETSHLPPPFSLIHFTWKCIRTSSASEEEKKCLSNSEMHGQENKWFDTVIRSAVIDSLEDYLKKERNAKGSRLAALMEKNSKNITKKIISELQGYIDTSLTDIKGLINAGCAVNVPNVEG